MSILRLGRNSDVVIRSGRDRLVGHQLRKAQLRMKGGHRQAKKEESDEVGIVVRRLRWIGAGSRETEAFSKWKLSWQSQ